MFYDRADALTNKKTKCIAKTKHILPLINNLVKPCLSTLSELLIAPYCQRHQAYSAIDEGIAPLVNVIRTLPRVTTIASCHGHSSGRIGGPYVYFTAPMDTAMQVHEACLAHTLAQDIDWAIYSASDGNLKQTWALCSPRIEELATHCKQLALLYSLGWQRQQMNDSIKSLAKRIGTGKCSPLPSIIQQNLTLHPPEQYLSLQTTLAAVPGVEMVDTLPSTSHPINAPSLFFKAPVNLALQLEACLYDLLIRYCIKGQWLLDGQFTADGTLTYQLYRHPMCKYALLPKELNKIKEMIKLTTFI